MREQRESRPSATKTNDGRPFNRVAKIFSSFARHQMKQKKTDKRCLFRFEKVRAAQWCSLSQRWVETELIVEPTKRDAERLIDQGLTPAALPKCPTRPETSSSQVRQRLAPSGDGRLATLFFPHCVVTRYV
jgi:hypothetical protein